MSHIVLPAALIAAFVSVVLLLALRPLAIAHRLVDKPGGRKRHVGHIPIIGGICMFAGFGVGAFMAMPASDTFYLILGAGLLVLVGLIDDRYDLKASTRLGAQVSSVLIMIFGGSLLVTSIGMPFFFGEVHLGGFALLVTVVFAVAIINAVNMTDGMDGLAGGLSLIALIGLGVAGSGSDATILALIGTAVTASFLTFNFPLKINRGIRTFMGDAGSTFLGFLIAWLCIAVTQGPGGELPFVAVLGLVALPLYDLTSCFFRRISARRSPFAADRNHFHHVLLKSGLKRRQVLAVLLPLGALVAGGTLILVSVGAPEGVILVSWCCTGVLIDFSLRQYCSFQKRRALEQV